MLLWLTTNLQSILTVQCLMPRVEELIKSFERDENAEIIFSHKPFS